MLEEAWKEKEQEDRKSIVAKKKLADEELARLAQQHLYLEGEASESTRSTFEPATSELAERKNEKLRQQEVYINRQIEREQISNKRNDAEFLSYVEQVTRMQEAQKKQGY